VLVHEISQLRIGIRGIVGPARLGLRPSPCWRCSPPS